MINTITDVFQSLICGGFYPTIDNSPTSGGVCIVHMRRGKPRVFATLVNQVTESYIPPVLKHQSNKIKKIIRIPACKRAVYDLATRIRESIPNRPENSRGGFGGLKRPVRIIDCNTDDVVVVDSITDAAEIASMSRRTITRCCNAGGATRNGMFFMYADHTID